MQVTYGTQASVVEGRADQDYYSVVFNADERLIGLGIDAGLVEGNLIVCQLNLTTNYATYGPFGQCSFNNCGSYTLPNGQFYSFISGRAYKYVDLLDFHYD